MSRSDTVCNRFATGTANQATLSLTVTRRGAESPGHGRASAPNRSALARIRTWDTRFRKPVLYPLSYEGGNRNVRSNVNWYLTISPDPREVEEGL